MQKIRAASPSPLLHHSGEDNVFPSLTRISGISFHGTGSSEMLGNDGEGVDFLKVHLLISKNDTADKAPVFQLCVV